MILPVTKEEYDALARNPYNTAVAHDIEEFIASDAEVCEVSADGYKNVHSCAGSYSSAAKRMNVGVIVTYRRGRVFLLKEAVNEP